MSSLRRTKNFANDGQTPIFLYTILKQLDLRSIDWNKVANRLDISNGHAARMRYSRMKQQFEGVANQPKAPKPKKDKDSDKKPSKEKPKNKRLLEDEENERLAIQRFNLQQPMAQQVDPKRIKLEQNPFMNPWSFPAMNIGPQHASSFCNQPTIKLEPLPFEGSNLHAQSVNSSPLVKKEPESSPAAFSNPLAPSSIIKQEPKVTMQDCELPNGSTAVIKKEPQSALSEKESVSNSCERCITSDYSSSRTASTYFNMEDHVDTHVEQSHGLLPGYSTLQPMSRYTYRPLPSHNQNINDFSWAQPASTPKDPSLSINPSAGNVMLNPYANSYKEMLHMPLYHHSPQPCDLQISTFKDTYTASLPSENNVCQAQKAEKGDHTVRAPSIHPLTISNSMVVSARISSALTDNSATTPERASPHHPRVQQWPRADIIEVDCDAEDEEDTVTEVKREPMEV